MIFEFYPWKIDVNKEETIKYYQTEDMSMAREINNIVTARMTKRHWRGRKRYHRQPRPGRAACRQNPGRGLAAGLPEQLLGHF